MNLIELNNISKSYDKTEVLKDINFSIKENEFVIIMGNSGSGKTTLLNCMSTIDIPSSGKVKFNNKDLIIMKEKDLADFRKSNLGFIFQDYNLLDTLTVYENIALALTIRNKTKNKIDISVRNVASKLGIDKILDHYPYQISGGQKQRCACARAIITSPKIIFADEPTGALDSKSSKNLMETLEFMLNKFNTTILMVTHDSYIASYATRVIFLKDGRIYKEIRKNNETQLEFYNKITKITNSTGEIR